MSVENTGIFSNIIMDISIIEPFFNDIVETFILVDASNTKLKRVDDGNEFGGGNMHSFFGEGWDNVIAGCEDDIDRASVSKSNIDQSIERDIATRDPSTEDALVSCQRH